MTSLVAPICIGCRHLDGRLFEPQRPEDPATCGAFPGGIPNEILLSRADHRLPFPGDRGVRFEPKTQADADYAAMIFEPVSAGDPA